MAARPIGRRARVLAVVAVSVAAVACRSSPASDEDRTAELVSRLADDLDDRLTSEQAACVVEALVDEVGLDDAEDLVVSGSLPAGPAPPTAEAASSTTVDEQDLVIDVLAGCDAVGAFSEGPGTTTSTAPASTTGGDSTPGGG